MSLSSRRYAVVAAAGLAGLLSVAGASSAQAALPAGVSADFGANGRVQAFLTVGDKVYVGGQFSRVKDNAGWHDANNVAVYNKSTKRYDLGFSAPTNGAVSGLAVLNGKLFLGGAFTSVKGVSRAHVAAVNASSGAVDTGFRADTNQDVDDVLVGSGKVYISGSFRTVNGAARNYVARLNPDNGQPDSWTPSPNGRVRDMALSNNGSAIFLVGSFSAVDGKGAHNKVARVGVASGAPTGGFVAGNTGVSSRQPVQAVAVGGGDRLVLAVGGAGGACTSMNGTTGARQWVHRLDGDAQAAEVVGNLAWCGGHFERVDGTVSRPKLVAFDAGSGALNGFNIDLNSNLGVWALAQSGSALLAGGDFTKVNQDAVDHIVSIVR